MPTLRPLVPLLLAAVAAAQTSDYRPKIEPASDEARKAMAAFQLAPDFEVSLFAAEPMLANPVTFCTDREGNFYVAETFRLHAGVTDNRLHLDWVDDDLACQSVDDRVAMYHKYLGDRFVSYTTEHERIRRITDTDGDGVADRAVVFADGFSAAPSGIAAGLLADGRDLWYTCIPSLWRLRDDDGDGVADRRDAVYSGFGVHTSLLGHDMHGLCLGPDGKLYFSIGDRGLNVVTEDGRHLFNPHSGAVLRCNRDGTGLELFATGLRNPQELAFDRFGNLFTGDNNSDGGDKARWVYVVEGGDSGWRLGYQYMRTRGAWNQEKLWYPHFRGQAAWMVPPVANVASGPAGLVHAPGTGLPDRYADSFFLCDFRGGSAQSGIHALSCEPKGAGFEMTRLEHLIWHVLATDIDFGPDGALYLTDWTEGWNMTGKGRIYRLADPEALARPEVARTRALLGSDLSARPVAELVELLDHADQRVRQRAQYALASRGVSVAPALAAAAQAPDHRMRRIHAVWALGQLAAGGAGADVLVPLRGLLRDGDGEIRAQAAKVLGEARDRAAAGTLLKLLGDRSSRVRYFAALALGKLAHRAAVPALLEMLRQNADEDVFLRHAGVMALVWIGDSDAVSAAAADAAPAVRMAALLVLRRWQSPDVARLLADPDPLLVVEAARAIHDVPISAGRPALAAVLERRAATDEPLLRRAIDANLRLGDAASAQRLADFAARPAAGDAMRELALQSLASWAAPAGRDRVLGLWRPIAPRSPDFAAAALRPRLNDLLQDASGSLRAAAVAAARSLSVREATPALVALVGDRDAPVAARTEALRTLEAWHYSELAQLAAGCSGSKRPALRREAFRITCALDPQAALPVLDSLLSEASIGERRQALALLGKLPQRAADDILLTWLDRLQKGEVPAELRLDLIEAASCRKAADVQRRLAAYQDSKPKDDPLSPYVEALDGGDAAAGRRVFEENPGASCRRCHTLDGSGGDAGPKLAGVGSRHTRTELLEALVAPSRTIAHGFGTEVVTLDDGSFHAGVVRSDSGGKVEIVTADGQKLSLPADHIVSRTQPVSAMPPMGGVLTRTELRDLVEFLASLK